MDFEFKACIKPKRNWKTDCNVCPFPNGSFEGVFTGLSVEVFQPDAVDEIYKNGSYGKGSDSRGSPETINESLVLQLEEAFFLAYYLKVLNIRDLECNPVDFQKLLAFAMNLNKRFVNTLAAYLYLKSKNWVVKSGCKYGGDFIIYKNGPEFFHASFVVYVLEPTETELFQHKNLQGIQRVAESANKDVLFLEVIKPKQFKIDSPEDLEQISVSEMILRRLKMSEYVEDE